MHDPLNVKQNILYCAEVLWRRICVAGKNKTSLGLYLRRSIFVSDCKQHFASLGRFSLKSPIPNFKEIRPVWAALIHADRRTDRRTEMTKIIHAFSDYANTTRMRTEITNFSSTALQVKQPKPSRCSGRHFFLQTYDRTWMADRTFAESSNYKGQHTNTKRRRYITPAGVEFELMISAWAVNYISIRRVTS
jgi:hypothetical protein